MSEQRHILSLLLENAPGALSRVVGLFSARGYNIESITVAPTEDPTISRMTMVSVADQATMEQITKQLNRLIEVIRVIDLLDSEHVERELMLVKLRAIGHNRDEIGRIVSIFRARIIDVTDRSFTVEVTGDTSKNDAFLRAIDNTLILETVRTGSCGIARGERMLKA